MWLAMTLLGIALTAQIPPPDLGPDSTPDLKSKRREIFERENASLKSLADRLDKEQKWDASRLVRNRVVRPTNSDALTRFMPLPEIVPAQTSGPSGGSEPWKSDLETIRKQAATEFLGLAKQAATASPPHWGLASLCVRDAIEHDPDQGEARRLLGFEPHEGGWARPFAIRQLKAGNVLHPLYGWVHKSWVPKLEAGQLPAPTNLRTSKKDMWLPAAAADRLRADGNPPWKISTEHFEIQSNVPLSKSIAFGRRLEAFHELFYTVMADVIGNRLPIANRIKNPSLRTEPAYRPHLIYYFATKDQYLDHLKNVAPPDVDQSLGYYDPPASGQKNRKPAYFFLDEGGQIDTLATLYHRGWQQLLFESPVGNAYRKNEGNYWVFEGLGTFFETVMIHPDGSMEVGGFVGPRIEAAVAQFARKQSEIPTGLFVGLRKEIFNLEGQIHTNYQQAMALTLFLMRWHDGTYRDAFLEYVRDALKGNLRPGQAPPLRDRLGVTYETIDAEFHEFLKSRDASTREPRRKEQAASARPAASGN